MVPTFNSGGKCINNLVILEKSVPDWPMNLTIDIGNTRTKLAIFDSDTLVETSVLSKENEDNEISSFIQAHPKVEQIIC